MEAPAWDAQDPEFAALDGPLITPRDSSPAQLSSGNTSLLGSSSFMLTYPAFLGVGTIHCSVALGGMCGDWFLGRFFIHS